MKLFRKLALLSMAMLTALSMGVAAACVENGDSSSSSLSDSSSTESSTNSSESASSESSSDDSSGSSVDDSSSDSSDEETEAEFVYRIKIQNETGYGFKKLKVALLDGEEEIAAKTTTNAGYATFHRTDIIELKEYTVQVEIPTGYALAEPDTEYKVAPWEGFELEINIAPQGVIMDKAPKGTSYALGDVVHDFSVKTSDGDTFTLSEALEEKELVLINFWATWCGPCTTEFPAMNAAYAAYQDKVAVIAISTTDSMQAVKDYKSKSGNEFPMTSNIDCGEDVRSRFPSSGIPLSVIVDRYGAVTFYHTGSMTEAKDFLSRFDKFLGEDYKPTIIVGSGENSGGNDGSQGGSNLIAPTVTAPALSEMKTTFAQGSKDFDFAWDTEDKYAWPWLIEGEYIYSPIAEKGLHGNYSTLKATFTAGPGDAIFFDYIINSEKTDILHVLIDGVPVQRLSGSHLPLTWTENFGAYYFKEGYDVEGKHEIIFLYLKDGDTSVEQEAVRLKNLRIERNVEDTSTLKSHVFRHAASILNEEENATTLYKEYATVVFNEADGYYHVGAANGPILLANMMLASRWSDTSLWILAYSNYIISEGYNFSSDIEDHAWAASQYIPGYEFLNGYVPVTEDLKELMIYATKSAPVKEEGLKLWKGAWHENEWLEMCVYYDSYGVPHLDDHMKTITFHAAVEIIPEVKNTANILYNMVPRGFKYKFIPERSGVYHVYSDTPLNPQIDPACFYFGTTTTEFRYYEESMFSQAGDGDFDFYVYMEAGKTYYFAMASYLDVAGSYDFYVKYHGPSHKYLENCATILSFNEVTSELFLYDGIEYAYSEADGYYHVKNEDGTLGSIIYADMLRPTIFIIDQSFENIVDNAANFEEKNRVLYIDGVDYTDVIADYVFDSYNAEYEGFVPLDKTLFDILRRLTLKYDGIEDSWQMLCYYEVSLGN